MRVLTRSEQRMRGEHVVGMSIRLGLHLRALVTDILQGDTAGLTEFQQLVQYAPMEMRDGLLEYLGHAAAPCVGGR